MLGQVRRTPPGLRLCSPLGEQMRLAALTAGPRAVGPQGAHPSPYQGFGARRAQSRIRLGVKCVPGFSQTWHFSFSLACALPFLFLATIGYPILEVFSRSPVESSLPNAAKGCLERILVLAFILRGRGSGSLRLLDIPQQPQLVCPMPRRDETDTLLAVADGGGTGTGGATSFNEHYWLMRTWPWSVA